MTIEVIQLPETKVWTDRFKRYMMTYPDGFPVTVRRVGRCSNCGIEIGGYFGNKVYRYYATNLCQGCGEKDDPIIQMCITQTGTTPFAYQQRHGVAWND